MGGIPHELQVSGGQCSRQRDHVVQRPGDRKNNLSEKKEVVVAYKGREITGRDKPGSGSQTRLCESDKGVGL